MLLDLNRCFPEPESGQARGPLPKQRLFLDKILDAQGPKYVAYISGIGGGKTLCGCIAMLCQAVLYPGDYLISRQFYPELRDTTYKTFLEICPPELIAEHRQADMIVKIKAVGGKLSTIMFRPLEEPDKLRSLNLSGAYIDEASQVSEEAFMLLQGRLRGRGLRKLIVTSNPAGHDYLYRWFIKQDHFKNEDAKSQYFLIKGSSLENIHLPDGYVQSMMDSWSNERIQREIMGSFDAFEGMIYSEFRRDTHVVQPFIIPDEWTKFVGVDHGYRNPACWLWGAQDYDGNVYIYREFYEREWLIEEICKGNRKQGRPGVVELTGSEKLEQIRIDPSTRARRGTTGGSDFDSYLDNLPKHFPLMLANNEVETGIDRVKSFLKIREDTKKPRLYIFSTCTNLIEELTQYRYEITPANQQVKRNEKETPVKKNDHAVDALRYLIMSRPEAPMKKEDVYTKIRYNSIEAALHQDLGRAKRPKKRDILSDI